MGCRVVIKDTSLPYLFVAGVKIVGFIPFPSVLLRDEILRASPRIPYNNRLAQWMPKSVEK